MTERFHNRLGEALGRAGVRRGELILLAISGGPDSTALLHALVDLQPRLGYTLAAAHFNHRLRGAESDRDQAFVRELCARLSVELAAGHAQELLAPGTGNLEEWAREMRYAFLHGTADRLGAAHIALAHHADDQAETVLMRLLRGSGVAGLAAMAEAGPGRLIRPMLSITRAEILAYLSEIGARFMTDSTNLSPAIARNRIRAQLIPHLERDYSPGLRHRLVEFAREMRSVDDLLGRMAADELVPMTSPEGALDLSRFALLHPALAGAVVRAFLHRRTGTLRRITRAHVEAIRQLCLIGPPNGRLDLPGGWRVERQYRLLRLREGSPAARAEGFFAPIDPEGTTRVRGMVFEGSLISPRGAAMPSSHLEALFDADRIGCGLSARNFVRGDRIRPLGIEGTRKVKDVFIEHQVPRGNRLDLPLVVAGDEVVWIPGLLRSRQALVTARTTRLLRLAARQIPV